MDNPLVRASLFIALVGSFSLATPAFAQDDDTGATEESTTSEDVSVEILKEQARESLDTGERLRLLRSELDGTRDELAGLRERRAQRQAAGGRGEGFQTRWGKDVLASWRDGFHIYLLEGEEGVQEPVHDIGIHALSQFDYNYFTDEHHPAKDQFQFTTLQLGSKGFAFHHLEYEVEADFSADGAATLADAYGNLHFWDVAQLKAGHVRTPIMQEQLYHEGYQHFVNAPMMRGVSQIGRDLGVLFHGDCGFANYQTGLVNGQAPNTNDTNQAKDFVARIQLTPFKPLHDERLQAFGLGASVTNGRRKDFNPAFTTTSGTPWVLPGVLAQEGDLTRVGADAVLAVGSFTFLWEYVLLRVHDLTTPTEIEDLDVHSWYLDFLYTLTHEPYTPGERATPHHDFDPLEGTWGMWQVGGRYERLWTDDEFARSFASSTDRLDSFTVGLNWYLNPLVKVQVNYQRIAFDDQLGRVRTDNTEDLVFARVQLDF